MRNLVVAVTAAILLGATPAPSAKPSPTPPPATITRPQEPALPMWMDTVCQHANAGRAVGAGLQVLPQGILVAHCQGGTFLLDPVRIS